MVAACPFPARRGTPLRVQRLAEALVERGHRVEIFTYDVGDREPLPYPVHRVGEQLLEEPMPPGPNLRKLALDPRLAALLRRHLLSGRFDIIHAHHIEGLMAALWARRAVPLPVVYDAHTRIGTELPSYGTKLLGKPVAWLGEMMDRELPRRADGVITVTEDIRDWLVAHGVHPADRVIVAMNGVRADTFDVPARMNPVRIIYTGTLAGYQDIDLLLEAFAQAHARRPQLVLTLAVSSSFEPFEGLAERLGIRSAIEVVDDCFAELPRRLAESGIAALPRTRCDGIPQKLLNYMAAAKAVVASAGSAKVLRHEETGLVVPNGDRQAFAAALVRLSDHPELIVRLGRRAREYVVTHCSWEGAARRVESLYERLLGPLEPESERRESVPA